MSVAIDHTEPWAAAEVLGLPDDGAHTRHELIDGTLIVPPALDYCGGDVSHKARFVLVQCDDSYCVGGPEFVVPQRAPCDLRASHVLRQYSVQARHLESTSWPTCSPCLLPGDRCQHARRSDRRPRRHRNDGVHPGRARRGCGLTDTAGRNPFYERIAVIARCRMTACRRYSTRNRRRWSRTSCSGSNGGNSAHA